MSKILPTNLFSCFKRPVEKESPLETNNNLYPPSKEQTTQGVARRTLKAKLGLGRLLKPGSSNNFAKASAMPQAQYTPALGNFIDNYRKAPVETTATLRLRQAIATLPPESRLKSKNAMTDISKISDQSERLAKLEGLLKAILSNPPARASAIPQAIPQAQYTPAPGSFLANYRKAPIETAARLRLRQAIATLPPELRLQSKNAMADILKMSDRSERLISLKSLSAIIAQNNAFIER